MPLVRVVQGQQVEAIAEFRDANGETLVGTGQPVIWAVRDFQNNLIANGAGSQGRSDPEVWTARFAIPETAPVSSNGERYQIIWEFPRDSGSVSAIERFEVIANGDPLITAQSSDVMVFEGKTFTDSLQVPAQIVPDSLRYEIRDLNNNLLLEEESSGSAPDRQQNNFYVYDFNSPEEIEGFRIGGQNSLTPYMGVWEYQLPGESRSYEFHGLYLTNLRAVSLVQKMRRLLDRANLQDIHPFLTFEDLDLLHYLYRGFEFINSWPPTLTNWNPGVIPAPAEDLVVKAGCMQALQAQYMAEGMTTFDFQGLGVQMSIDRTQFIQSLYDQLNTELTDRVPRFKRLYLRSSSPGVLNITASPLTAFTINVDTSFYSRADIYRAIPFNVFGF